MRILETSVLTALRTVNEQIQTQLSPDLAIEKVSLQRVSIPREDFNYYRYKATMIIHNYGGNLEDGQLVISAGDNQKKSFIKNTETGFSLRASGTYIARDYEVLFDGDYNGGSLEFKIELNGSEDSNELNNSKTAYVFENPAKIRSLGLKRFLKDESFSLGMEFPDSYLENHKFETFSVREKEFSNEELKYAELVDDEAVYSYYRARNSQKTVYEANWISVDSDIEHLDSVQFSENPWTDQDDHYFYIKATNLKNGIVITII
jgi:hypothetical protein